MNKARREAISKLQTKLAELKKRIDFSAVLTPIEALRDDIEGLKEDIDGPKEEEQEYYDNMPEGLQSGEKGENAQTAIGALEEAQNKLDEFIEKLDTIKEAVEGLEETIDECDTSLGATQDG